VKTIQVKGHSASAGFDQSGEGIEIRIVCGSSFCSGFESLGDVVRNAPGVHVYHPANSTVAPVD